MDVKQCDRCGKFYELYNHLELNCIKLGKETYSKISWNEKYEYDLCSECMKELLKWLKREGEA